MDECWIPMCDDAFWVPEDSARWRPLSAEEWQWFGAPSAFEIDFRAANGRLCHVVSITKGETPVAQGQFVSLRALLPSMDRETFVLSSKASQLATWRSDHGFCGRCAHATEQSTQEYAMSCPSCNRHWYPRLSPCAIVLVTRGEELLLGRNANFPPDMFSALAGFVEVGETVEETACREVQEEANVEIGNLCYYASQNWPFPAQMMLGFHAEYVSGEVRPDGVEVIEANFFHVDSLPRVPPAGFSVAGELIQSAVARIKSR